MLRLNTWAGSIVHPMPAPEANIPAYDLVPKRPAAIISISPERPMNTSKVSLLLYYQVLHEQFKGWVRMRHIRFQLFLVTHFWSFIDDWIPELPTDLGQQHVLPVEHVLYQAWQLNHGATESMAW